jgi:putative membrane-bound dehydrogenase-like protein
LIFEDTNGDGTLDSRKVFAEGLNLISGMEVGFGGVWVGAAPYFMFIADANKDDVADGAPTILLDGWGLQDTHETLNTFNWGPDGWLYGCHGVFTHSKVGKPGTPDQDRQPINAGVWRYHPTRHVFEVFSHGTSNPWGVDFNDRGQAFITSCVIPHLYHMIQGARYERQAGQHFNPYTYDDIKTIADHRHYVGANPHAGNGKSDAAGGGHAHAGAMIYLGDAWPKEYRDRLFMNNIHGQRLNVDVPNANRSGYVGSHAPDFLLTGDKASQILNLRYGPDGQAWMIDWYDMQACHLTDPGRHDRSNGRIYKIAYGVNKATKVDLAKMSDSQLVKNMLHQNEWYVRQSRRLLQERAAVGKVDPAAIAELKKMAIGEADESRRLRATWTLSAIESLDRETCTQLLADKSEYVRAWAIQLGLDMPSAKVRTQGLGTPVSPERLTQMAATDPSPVVRLYLASAAQRLPLEQRWSLLTALLTHAEDATDHNLPLMYWYAAEPLAAVDPERALALGLSASKTIPLIRDYMLRRIGASSSESAIATLVGGLSKAETEELQLSYLDAIRTSLAGQRRVDPPAQWDAVFAKLSTGSAKVKLQSQSLGVTFGSESALAAVRKLVESEKETAETRVAALGSLLGAKDPKLAPVLQKLLNDKAMRSAALSGLAQYSDPKTATSILSVYQDLSQSDRRVALGTLASRADDAIAMLQAVEAKKIASADLSADLVRQLEYLKNDSVNQILAKTWGTVRETPAEKAKLIEEYKDLITSKKGPKPDVSLGRAVFAKTCQQCHVLFATGGQIGPELTGSNRANLDYLLSNIVDPSSVMAKEYQPTIVLTEGRTITGLVKAEDAKTITIQTATAVEIIPKDEIEERKLSDKSMMPDDQLRQFSPHEVRSLVAYLASDRQVPLMATSTNAAEFFNAKDLAMWRGDAKLWSVENGELVGKSTGLAHNDFLISDMSVEDFHLTVEVKLVGNAGNSGIQFRSQPTEEGIKGYQADIGAGWWGKLYEEEGRALLWDKSGEEHVKLNEWNKYEVKAQGNRIQTWINGHLCVDLDDPKGAKRGIIALQLHSGEATEVRFKNMQLQVLESK